MSMDLHIGENEGPKESAPEPDTSTPADPLGDIRTGLKAAFSATVSIGESVDRMEKNWRNLTRRLQHTTPVWYRPTAAAVCPTPTGAFILNLGQPDMGTFWEVKNVVVGGTDVNVAAAGTVGLYVGQPPIGPGGAPGGLLNAVDLAATLPVARTYGTGQIVVLDGQYMFAVVFGGTAGQQYAAASFVVVVPNDVAGRDVVDL